LIFRYLQAKQRVQVWLFDNAELLIEGQIIGFDEYMNLVLEHAEEIHKGTRTPIGRILLKGDAVSLLRSAAASAS
jgi:small nuclear ribonucleoprotein E